MSSKAISSLAAHLASPRPCRSRSSSGSYSVTSPRHHRRHRGRPCRSRLPHWPRGGASSSTSWGTRLATDRSGGRAGRPSRLHRPMATHPFRRRRPRHHPNHHSHQWCRSLPCRHYRRSCHALPRRRALPGHQHHHSTRTRRRRRCRSSARTIPVVTLRRIRHHRCCPQCHRYRQCHQLGHPRRQRSQSCRRHQLCRPNRPHPRSRPVHPIHRCYL